MEEKLYSYDEVLKELSGKREETLHFLDIKNLYYIAKCWGNKIKWCYHDQGHYKEGYSYSDKVQSYIQGTQFKKVIGAHPWV